MKHKGIGNRPSFKTKKVAIAGDLLVIKRKVLYERNKKEL
jgi:hypothetical protein